MLQVGFGKADITPVIPVPLGGYEKRNGLSIGVHLPIYARAMAVNSQGKYSIFISLELLGVDLDFTYVLRQEICKVLNLNPSSILISATHTHSSIESFPAHMYKGLWVDYPPLGQLNRTEVKDQILSAVQTALEAMEPVMAYEARGKGRLGGNRKIRGGVFDNELVHLKFVTPFGRLVGSLLNYSCHPTILDPFNLAVSGDYAGWVMKQLESNNSVCLFLNGAAGDVSTRFQRQEATFTEVERLGNLLLGDVMRLDYSPVCIDRILSEEVSVHLTQRNLTRLDTILQMIRLGELTFLAFPGELFTEEGLHLKSLHPGLIFVGYANDYVGYVLNDKSYGEGGYERQVTRLDLTEKRQLMDCTARLIQ